jgi:hypothetical protein
MHTMILCLLAVAGPDEALYAEKVRPILATHCFKCHGPDKATRKGKLRLDLRAEAVKRAIVPGKPDESELMARILSDEPRQVMPPPHAKMPLSEGQKRILRDWIARGAPYASHWAFTPLRRPPVPGGARRAEEWGWRSNNPIDRFLLDRLTREGLRPSREADRATLLRRVTLDLVGLPPTEAELEAFLEDQRPDAYERVVHRLLASPAYGERWARKWLDLARYADTNGYEKDRPRSIWPWRDWVISAINANLPFDQFSIEQLAGDMIPGGSKVATGLHRNTMLNEEGGIDPLEFRFHAMTDRVAATGTIWLGLTLGCVQCHTHKYDPVTHREYYALMAYLNNADEVTIEVPDADVERKRQEAERKAAAAEKALASKFPGGEAAREAAFLKWLGQEQARSADWHSWTLASARANLARLDAQPDGSLLARGDITKSDTYELTFTGVREGTTHIRLEALPDPRLPGGGPGRVYYEGPEGDFFLSELRLFADGKPVKIASATQSFAAKGSSAAAALDGDKQTGWSIHGRQGRESHAVFKLAEPLGKVREARVTLLFERYYAAPLGRLRIRATCDPVAEARDLPIDADSVLRLGKPTRAARELHLRAAPELARAREEIEAIRKSAPRHPTTLVFQERPKDHPRPTHRHHRGEYLQPKEEVLPGLPSALGAKSSPRDRLELARWLFTEESPLTARVTANRHWAAFFGTGLVRTLEDFGTQGELPSHPELLDWLAVELRESGWDLKALHRLIVTSAAYRQSSVVRADLREKDPGNRLLARGPRLRLDAEQVRDTVLAVSGLLHPRLGGPSVFPPQPASVTTEGAYGPFPWKPSEGLDRYRRGLYTFTKRTTPFAFSSVFDAPSGEVCVARREVTNTPLQALALLNDELTLEASRALASWAAEVDGGWAQKSHALFRRVLGREPTLAELTQVTAFVVAQKGRADSGDLDAAALAGPGRGDVNERAAWVALARVLLNLDELIVRG